jgi:hypothetical protein
MFILHNQSHGAASSNLTNLIKTYVHGSVLGLGKEESIKAKTSHFHSAHDDNVSKSVGAEETDSDTDVGACMIKEITKILEQLKRHTDGRTESYVGEILIVKWIIDQIGTVRNIPVVCNMVKQLQVMLMAEEDNQNVILHYIACTNSITCNELVVDIINLSSDISQLYSSSTSKDIQLFQDDFRNMAELLNDIMTGIYRHKFGLSHKKMEKALDKQLKNLKGMIINCLS